MSEEKYSKEIEKLQAEIERSLHVVKMKEAHKQIEEIEKLRKQASITSICKRIKHYDSLLSAVYKTSLEFKKEHPDFFESKITENSSVKLFLDQYIKMYKSIRFDLQRTINIKKEDFDRLFPEIKFDFTTYDSILTVLISVRIQTTDMLNYCLRLLL